MALMQRRHYDSFADEVALVLGWPTYITAMADKLAATNPKFDKEKFVARATAAWEKANPVEDIDDGIPY